MMFHWKYADERSLAKGEIGWFVSQVSDPDRAVQVANAIDTKFANSPYETKTDTEQAFSAQFASMLGNLNVLLGSVALAVVITTLFVAGNTMAMSVRERTTEIAVMRTLGFPSSTVFALVARRPGGLGDRRRGRRYTGARHCQRRIARSHRRLHSGLRRQQRELAVGLGLSVLIGLLAALMPASAASRLRIVDALRRVA
jgi:putative ABC transport system permease protein